MKNSFERFLLRVRLPEIKAGKFHDIKNTIQFCGKNSQVQYVSV